MSNINDPIPSYVDKVEIVTASTDALLSEGLVLTYIYQIFSPLVAILYFQTVISWNHSLPFATVGLAHASVEHLIDFELAGGNNHSQPNQKPNIRPTHNYFYNISRS
jgi:hypothetical protein